MVLAEVGVAVGDEHCSAPSIDRPRTCLSSATDCPSAQWKSSEHHAQRAPSRHRAQQLGDRLEQQEPLGLRIRGLRRRRIRHPAREVASEPADLAAEPLHIARPARRPAHARQTASTPRSTAHTAPRDPPSSAPQHTANPSAFAPSAAYDANLRLPDPRLTRQQHHLTRARPRLYPRAARAALARSRAPHTPTRGTARSASGNGHRPTAQPAPLRPTAPTTRGTPPSAPGSPSTPTRPTDSNRAPSTRPASILRRRRNQDPVRRRLVTQPAPPRSTASRNSPRP